MTMIASATTAVAAIHASDRRVSIVRNNKLAGVHSSVENKSVIFLCRDAVGAIGFTGVAYIEGHTTDTWIAKTITERANPDAAGGGFAVAQGRNGMERLRLTALIRRLRNAMSSLPQKYGQAGLTVQLVGFRIRRKRCYRFYTEISWSGAEPVVSSWLRLPRNRQQRYMLGLVGDCPTGDEAARIVTEHADKVGTKDTEALRQGLVHAVRTRASSTSTVGQDVMTITIPHPAIAREIVWQFEPAVEHKGVIQGEKAGKQIFDAVYSPWILAPGVIMAPTISTSAMEVHSGGYLIRSGNRPPKPANGLQFAMSSQVRKPPPR